MTEGARIKNFLIDLDQLISENECYDDDLKKEVCNITEEQCYNVIMKTKDYHLLGIEKVKGFIHLFINDFETRMVILSLFNAL